MYNSRSSDPTNPLFTSRIGWLTTALIVIFLLCNFTSLPHYDTQVTPSTPSTPSEPTPTPSTSARPKSDLDKDPLRIYIPPSVLAHHNPLEDIWADGTSKSAGAEPHDSSPQIDSTSPSAHSRECPIQPFDISKCPSVQRIQSHMHPSFSTSSTTNNQIHNTVPPAPDRPLITYAYYETEFARINLQFFIKHGLHNGADFVFILNGDTDVDTTVIPQVPNVSIVKRENTCFDLGAHAEVLGAEREGKRPLRDSYKRFILMNASIRGPFMPHWSRECWSESYLGRVNEKVKLVGSSLNCMGGTSPHVQSMIWATDLVGLNILLEPAAIGECFATLDAAVDAEVRSTAHIRSKGFEVDVMLSMYQTAKGFNFDECQEGDFLFEGGYFGFSVHPYETLFLKSNRGIQDGLLEKLSEWQGASAYSSYNVCK